ncbi:Golgi mannosyltransferase complex subunit [Microbotryomycetes sp. JL201]|nr:Golgi mannosyltransferase complex subunit [Microbotryomycetes sp. JL201]
MYSSIKRSTLRNGRDHPPLPVRNPYISAKDTRAPSIRVNLIRILSRRRNLALVAFTTFVFVLWLLGVGKGKANRERLRGGPRVVARDWQHLQTTASAWNASFNQTVLILCPMKNSIEHIWHFFHMMDTLSYPRHLIHLGVLISDTSDRTYERALELADERQYGWPQRKRYGGISVFRKDFAEEMKFHSSNVGKERHDFALQVARRKVLAVSRTWLLNSAMKPETDWVLWMDVDVVDYDKNLIQHLLGYSAKENGDVVVPNCVWKTYNEMGSYDRNNWAETPESLEMKAKLGPDDILIEGYEKELKTGRSNMADLVPSTATTPEIMQLDGVGGCTTLVRADVHRKGAVFPAWPVDHQIETEGFAQLAKALGHRLIGLPKYYVYHGLYG